MSTIAKTKSSQDFVKLKEIRDNVVIMKDGGLRMVLLASSINYDLKSADEKRGVIQQFQSFLNSLDFQVQIVVQSRRLDIRPYIQNLEQAEKDQVNELLKVQIREYISFIRTFSESQNIMTKTFLLVVPLDVSIVTNSGFLTKITGLGKKTSAESKFDFQEQKTQLEQRLAVVQSGLASLGVRTALLGTEELIEVYFKMYNPGESDAPSINNLQL